MAKKKKANKKGKSANTKYVAEKKSEEVSKVSDDKEESTAAVKESKTSEKKVEKKTEKKAEKKPNVFAKIAKYFRECRSEIKKIVWPTPKATFKNVGIVLSVLVIIGLFVYGLDTGFIALLKLIMDF